MNQKKMYKVGSLFAGVGGICQGFKNAGYSISWANELDTKACETYRLNHNKTNLVVGDINNVGISSLKKIDILTAGFPCQPFSLAGKKRGFEDDRGKVFYRVIDFLKQLKPKAFLLENVKNLATHDDGNSFKKVKESIINSGYSFIPFILKSNEICDIPQARERLYIVGFRNESSFFYDFPVKENTLKLKKSFSEEFTIPKKNVDSNVKHFKEFLDPGSIHVSDYYDDFDNHIHKKVANAIDCVDSVYQYRRHYVRKNKSKVCPTLTANMGSGGHNVPIIHDNKGPRKLNPRECFNLQGFPFDFKFPNIARGHLYKQAGNSVVVPVVKEIAKNILNALNSKK